ncbi:MAG: hypothetical protein H5U21_07235, partial [Porphyrobacter sp.]|nr:hypothetical protein [Porphyrobacter sp.]
TGALARFEAVFDRFFREYQQYQIDSAAWDARFGERFGPSQPGWVAVHGGTATSLAGGLAEVGAPRLAGEVRDAEAGGMIPIIIPPIVPATPVVQPLAADAATAGSQ